ncbi:MAG TPA: NUDIX hydrolase [Dehalococcoidia bacterium]|nr:NUDIX hydrolase [Dehalococcoidia bacterium]
MRRTGQRLRIEDAVSAGGIVYRRTEGGIEVVLCGRMPQGIWGLPKGTPIPGETLEQTALREVREETGLEVRIDRKVGEIEYWFSRVEQGVRFHKRVHHYLMVPTGGNTADHDHEYDVVQWFSLWDAEHALTYANEAEILRRAAAMLNTPANQATGAAADGS